MAQDSAFHQGQSEGHAVSTDVWSAPYSANEYADIYSKILASNAAQGYVIPGYGNNLQVTANNPAAMQVIVKSGAAFIRGRIYENTADTTLTIAAANGSNPRLDRVVLRYDDDAVTITLAVLTGTAAATPSLPALTQNATIYEIELAHIWVTTSITTIQAAEIHDTRAFATTYESLANGLSQRNLVFNSEFIAATCIFTGGASAPEGWEVFNTGPVITGGIPKPSQMIRGRAIRMTTGGANRGITHTISVRASTTYIIKILHRVTAGDTGRITVDGNSSGSFFDVNLRRTGSWLEEQFVITTDVADNEVAFTIMCVNNTDIVDVGQCLAFEGYHTGPYRIFSETIMFDAPLTDASWTATAYSTSSNNVELASSFGSLYGEGIGVRGVFISLEANDSGSAAGTATIEARAIDGSPSESTIYLRGVPNDIKRKQQIYVPSRIPTSNGGFNINIVATGAGTLDATIQILGVVT